jgi:hypothetical protein
MTYLQILEHKVNIIEQVEQDANVKHANITTIYNQYLVRNYLKKDIKMPSGKAWYC